MTPGPVDDGTQRQRLATRLTVTAVCGIAVISATAIGLATDKERVAQGVMTSVLPLLGSWVATVLAYYFAHENLRATASTVSAMGPPTARGLAAVAVRDKMVPRAQIAALSELLATTADPPLAAVIAFLTDRALRRAPIFDDAGAVTHVVPLSVLDEVVRAEAAGGGKPFAALRWSDVLADPAIAARLTGAFVVVAETASLADARARLAGRAGCEDVFVTAQGGAGERVLGGLTDAAILEACP